MFDVFYLTKKPNLFGHEQHAESIEQARSLSKTRYFWIVDYLCDYSEWDFLWEPVPWEKDFRHAFASQHQADCGTYLVPKTGYTETKYNSLVILRLPNKKDWINTDFDDFDYSWHPDPAEPPYLYHFSTQHQRAGGPVYKVADATNIKYVRNLQVVKKTVDNNWDNLSYDFDYTWHPDPTDKPYIYQFGTQHQKTGGPRYTVPGATDVKYIEDVRVVKTSVDNNWNDLSYDFDYTWHPDATDEPYIYQFGTQHQKTGGPRYAVPGATEVKYVRTIRSNKTAVDDNWQVPDNVDVSEFDFTWHPDATDKPYIYQFGTQHQKTGGPRYVMPEATEVKYVRTIKCKRVAIEDNWEIPEGVTDFDYTWHPDSTNEPFIYQFGTQWQKTGGPRYVVPGATEIKYIHSPRCEKTSVDDKWQVPDNIKFEDFDYTWHPDATDEPYIYQFGTQHQKTGGPRYVMPEATEVKYVDQIRIKAEKFASGAIVIDHFDGNSQAVKQQVEKRIDVLRVARYFDNYKDTLKRVLSTLDDQEFVWIVSSVCDYKDFDFTWHPEVWQISMLHVFASNEQKFGDTFFVHVPTFLDKIDSVDLLEWYDCNFLEDVNVPRRPMPIVTHNHDSHMDYVDNFKWKQPLVVLSNAEVDLTNIPTVNLWREKTKTVVPLTDGATNVIVPRVAVPYIKTQMYDYPHIDKTYRSCGHDSPMDIVFISNGESNAERNWKHLQTIAKTIPNRVLRVDGVKGRAQAYRAALDASETPWAFCVFAKLEVNADFDWNWQPDRMQQSKHYIFHAHNPVNGLEYGHMAMIAYNKKLVKINPATGLDFTLDQAHEVVPLLSGVARYADDPWIAWRSSFRECLKLYHSLPDIENEFRLQQWLKVNLQEDAVGDWSIRGAEDAVEYYNSVQGSFDALRLTYEWDWLANYFTQKHSLTPDQLCIRFQDR